MAGKTLGLILDSVCIVMNLIVIIMLLKHWKK